MKKTMFRGRKYSGKSIIATVIGSISLITLLLMIILSGILKVETGNLFGIIGVCDFLLSIVGLILALRSFSERDIYYVVSIVAGVLNSMSIIGCLVLYIIGTRVSVL